MNGREERTEDEVLVRVLVVVVVVVVVVIVVVEAPLAFLSACP